MAVPLANDFTFNTISLGSASAQFQILASATLDPNLSDDLLWADTQNNQLIAWLMTDGTLPTVEQQPLGFISPEWDVVATGDFDFSRVFEALNDDLLWRNESTGQLQEWQFS